ncbi:MAG: metallophosphoesterase family protein [Gammaproteobacteria bacterium]
MLKVGILSDTHGFIDPRIVNTVNTCDHIIHAGDICGADILAQLRPRIALHAVAGNNDHAAAWSAAEHAVVNALPAQIELTLPGGLVIIEHGHRLGGFPDHEQFRWDHAEARMIVYGHTHKRVIDQSAEPWIINPGAAGKERTRGGPSCLVLHASENAWKIETVVFADEAAA